MAKSTDGTTRIYRTSLFPRVFAILFTVLSIFFGVAFWGGAIAGTREGSFTELVMPPLLVAFGLYLTVSAFTSYVALSQSEIILHVPFNRQSLPFDRIRGRRRYLDKEADESPP